VIFSLPVEPVSGLYRSWLHFTFLVTSIAGNADRAKVCDFIVKDRGGISVLAVVKCLLNALLWPAWKQTNQAGKAGPCHRLANMSWFTARSSVAWAIAIKTAHGKTSIPMKLCLTLLISPR
jgi:hypothetical protein